MGALAYVRESVETADSRICSGRGSIRSSIWGHPLIKLGQAIDRGFVKASCGAVYTDAPGHPSLPSRLMAGLAIIISMHDLSDEGLCDRSSMTRWRQRMGEDKLNAVLEESLATAVRTEAAKPADFTKAIVDITVQAKAVTYPTDAKRMHRARERLVRLARTLGADLRVFSLHTPEVECIGKR